MVSFRVTIILYIKTRSDQPIYPGVTAVQTMGYSSCGQTANVNLYHVTKFANDSSFTVHYNYTKITRFTPILSIRIVLSCFYLLIFLILEISHLNLTFFMSRFARSCQICNFSCFCEKIARLAMFLKPVAKIAKNRKSPFFFINF